MGIITEYFEQSQLAMAAYADLASGISGSAYTNNLEDVGMTNSQAEAFAAEYNVIDQYSDPNTGFSGTVFEKDGAHYFAIRGSATPALSADAYLDWVIADADEIYDEGIAIHQGLVMLNWVQRLFGEPGSSVVQYTYNANGTISTYSDTATGLLAGQTSPMTVTGHSLGGHLTMMLGRMAPDLFNAIYTYNAPGFDEQNSGITSDGFFNALADTDVPLTGAIASSWGAAPPITSWNVEGDIVHLIGSTPGSSGFVFSESANQGAGDAHLKEPFTDSLAVCALFGELSLSADLVAIGDILRAAANQNDMTLETAVNALGDLFGVGTTISGSETDLRDALYTRIKNIQASAGYTDAKLHADSIFIAPLVGADSVEQAELIAQSDTPAGLAYRYALVNLLPFVITGDAALYAPHNSNGELDLYDAATGQGALTDQYLQDRADMLAWKLKFDGGQYDYNDLASILNLENLALIGDKAYSDQWDSNTTPGDWRYVDYGTQTNGAPLSLFIDGVGDSTFVTDPDHQILFGSGDDDALAGQDTSDNLYGDAGQDILYGNQGGDYLEGGRDEDLLVGGLGDDHLVGGQGHDTYVYRTGEGVDTIIDIDGAIHFEGVVLEGGAVSETDADTFISDDGKFTYTRTETTTGTDVWVNNVIKIENYHPGDLGIVLGDPVEEPVQYLNVYLQDLVHLDDPHQRGYIPGSDGVVRAWSRYGDFLRVGVYEGDPPHELLAITVEGELYPYYGGETYTDWAFVSENIVAEVEDWSIVTVGGSGGDRVTTGEGSDYVSTTPARPFIYGTDSLDEVQIISGAYVYVPAEAGPDYVDTGAGRDFATTDGGDDTIFMGSGQDAAAAGDGDDSVDGGDDGDLLSGGSGNDFMQGGSGNDLLFGDSHYSPHSNLLENDWRIWDFSIDYSISNDGHHSNFYYPLVNVYQGTNTEPDGNDILYGGQGIDIIHGEGGDDILSGDEDVDCIVGGADKDLLMGGEGDDWLWGDDDENVAITADDTLLGEAGVDHLYGGPGNDVLFGGEDGDHLKGDDMSDSISVSGNDALYGENGDDELIGGPGDDYLDGGAGADELWGDHDHRFPGMVGNDILIGGAGDDYLEGGAGTDILFGGEGDDIYVVDDASDVIAENDAEGVDTVVVSFDYILPNNIENIAVLSSVAANATGSAGANRLFGSEFTNTLAGLEGDDLLFGRAGDDVLNGGAGADQLFGENGNDRLNGGAQNDALLGGAGNDVFVATLGSGTDTIIDVEGINTVEFGAGITQDGLDFVQYQGDDGAYYLRVNYGTSGDAIIIKNGPSGAIQNYRFNDGSTLTHEVLMGQEPVPLLIEGTPYNDVIHGSVMADHINAGSGDDQVFGAAGADTLIGGQGADTLDGGADNDTLDGGAGNDTLSGGVGEDRYVLQWGMGSDLVIEDGATLSTLELGFGVQLRDLDIWRDQNDLLVRFAGSTGGVRIQGYGASPLNWQIQDESGVAHVLEDLVSQPPSTATPFDFEDVSSSFISTVRSNYIETLMQPGESTGYTMAADGVLRRVNFYVSDNYSATVHRSANILVEDVTTNSDAYVQDTAALSSEYTSSQTSIRAATMTPTIGSTGGMSGYGAGTRTYYSFDQSVSYEIPSGAGVVTVYGTTNDQDGGQDVQLDGYTGDIGTQQPIGVWVFENGAGTGIATTITHAISHRDDTLTVERVTGGAGNNAITVEGHAVVDGGGGDDLIVATAVRWDSSYDNYFVPDQYGFNGQFDSRNVGSLLYGNNGADQIVGGTSNDLLIGGSGADYIDGRMGEDVYAVRAGEAGFDVIADSGKFIKVQNETGHSRYADWYYQSIGMPDYVDRVFQGESIPPLPAPSPNDFDAMQQLSVESVIETDTVEFSEGILLDQLILTWGDLVLESPVSLVGYQETPWMDDLGTAFRTLDISWAPGEGVRIVIPHTYVPATLSEEDEPLDAFGNLMFDRSDQYLGLGIEQFRFADGTTLSIADMVELAPPAPSFDPHLQGNDLTIIGTADNDILVGQNGNDILDGLEGADQLSGGGGDDTYYVDNLGDVITESIDSGADTVSSTVSYALTANVEYLTLTGDAEVDGTGNELSNLLTGNDVVNVLNGEDGDDTLWGLAGDDTLYGGAGNDVLETGYGFDYAYGGLGNDTLTGGDNASGTWTAEYLYGEDGDDLIQGGGKYAHLYGGAGTDVLRGGAGYQQLYGEEGDDTLIAGGSTYILNGGAGADQMVGGVTSNTFVVDNVGDVIVEAAGGGTDTVNSSLAYTLGDELENLTLTGTAAITGTGNAGNNTLDGSQNTAANVLAGGLGDDTYKLGVGDVVVENADAGTDTVSTAFSYTLGENIENLTLTSVTNDNATGNSLNNRLVGNGYNNTLSGLVGNDYLNGGNGNDVLNGGIGADEMLGGYGNDTYYVDDASDLVTELSGQGTDTVNSAINYTLGANVERLTLTGVMAIDGTGNTLSNLLMGNDATNVLSGDAGNDMLRGMAGDDTLNGGAGNDVLETGYGFDYAYGGAGNDTLTGGNNVSGGWSAEYLYGEDGDDLIQGGGKYAHLYGGAGNDELRAGSGYQNLYGEDGDDTLIAGGSTYILNGGAGADRMMGGVTSNTFVVDNVGDVIVEVAGGGTDTVNSSIAYTLGDEVENLTLTGTATISGTGNAGNNTLGGNANTAANVLSGGLGDDIYRLGVGDTVVENADAGTDTVNAAFSYTLGNNVENLLLTSTVNDNGTGNSLNNQLLGNNYNNTLSGLAGIDYLNGGSGNDVLNGGTGADEMLGGYGNDTFYVNDASDLVTELSAQGTDMVNSAISYTLGANVERLTLTEAVAIDGTGNTLSNILTGNHVVNILSGGAGNDSLLGHMGNDTLSGGSGNDSLTGGQGSDTYSFSRNDGTDVVSDYDAKDANPSMYGATTDVIQLAGDITHDQLWFTRSGNDLLMRVIGTTDQMTIQGWYTGSAYQIEEVHAGDGYLLMNEQVDQLVQAMAAFAPPLSGELSLPESYRTDLDPVIAANWQTA